VNDPHISALVYRLKTRTEFSFVDPPPVEHHAPGFDARLSGDELRIAMREHYPTEKEARAAVQPFVDAWEVDAALAHGRRYFWFLFENSFVVDRQPSQGGLHGVLQATAQASASMRGTLSASRTTYPPPPTDFHVSALVRDLWDRYEATVDGRELITSAGYYCETGLTSLAPGKKGKPAWVARTLSIEEAILSKLNRLTNIGSAQTARKHSAQPVSHTGAEIAWLQRAVPMLIRRLGQWEHDRTAKLPILTMADLPPL
jgi:hypothetical protein